MASKRASSKRGAKSPSRSTKKAGISKGRAKKGRATKKSAKGGAKQGSAKRGRAKKGSTKKATATKSGGGVHVSVGGPIARFDATSGMTGGIRPSNAMFAGTVTYRARCQQGDFNGRPHNDRATATRDALLHQGNHPGHIVEILVDQS